MPKECAAVGCTEKYKKGTPFTFHSFPKQNPLRSKWLAQMNRLDTDSSRRRLWEPKAHDRLSSKHFLSSCFDQLFVKMPKECAAVGCTEKYKKGTPFTFHSFPKQNPLRSKWLAQMNRLDTDSSRRRLWEPKAHDRLCSKHFLSSCFDQRTNLSVQFGIEYAPRLLPDAVPTIFIHRKRTEPRDSGAAAKRRRRELLEEMCHSDSDASAESDHAAATMKHEVDSVQLVPDITQSPNDVGMQVKPETKSVKVQTALPKKMTCTCRETQTVGLSTATCGTQTEPTPSITSQECQTDPVRSVLVEGDQADQEEETDDEDPQDSDWNDEGKRNGKYLQEDLNTMNPFLERKYIVFESQLLELLGVCRICSKPAQVIQTEECGTSVTYDCTCDNCGHNFQWHSQPYSYRLPLGNFVLAAAAFFTATSAARLVTCLKKANIASFSQQTYSNLQTAYLLPSVRNIWKRCQDRLFSARQNMLIKLAGDGRCNSPGHTAKYGSYTLMDTETAEVLHAELMQSNQVKNSHAMELEGLKRGLTEVKRRVTVSHLITDRHTSVKKYMGTQQPDIKHRYDIWHMKKGVTKKIESAGKSTVMAILKLWAKSIGNHMYWCSVSTEEGDQRQQVVKDKWLSILNHVADKHEGHGPSFPNCAHGPMEPKAWIREGTRQHRCLQKIVASPYLLKDIGMLSSDVQTYYLESFHSVLCHFAPKLNHFTYPVMQAKLMLAAIHFNCNANRDQAIRNDGVPKWKIARPRATKGAPVAKPVKTPVSYEYMGELFQEAILMRVTYPSYKKAIAAQADYANYVPVPLSHTAGPVDKQQVVDQHRPRFIPSTE